MAFRKKTLRTMSPTARKVARLAGELDSVARRLKNLIPELQRLDLDSRALVNAKAPNPEEFIQNWLQTKPPQDDVLAIHRLIVNYRMELDI